MTLLSKKERKCIGAGFVALDIVRSINGHVVERRYAGGSCGNVITILSFLGWSTALVARIGDDQLGKELIKDLELWSVDTRYLIQETSAQTPVVFQDITYNKNGSARHRFSRVCPCCGTRTAGYRPLLKRSIEDYRSLVQSASVFYFDRVSKSNLELALQAKLSGSLVVFEPSGIKDSVLFSDCLKASHVFKYSKDRLSGVRDAASEAGVPVEVETHGSAGLLLTIRSDKGISFQEELPVFLAPRLRDAAGSGDWCTAGIIHFLFKKPIQWDGLAEDSKTIIDAVRYGQALASINCSFESARGSMYSMQQYQIIETVESMLKGGYVEFKDYENEVCNTKESMQLHTCMVCNRKLK